MTAKAQEAQKSDHAISLERQLQSWYNIITHVASAMSLTLYLVCHIGY